MDVCGFVHREEFPPGTPRWPKSKGSATNSIRGSLMNMTAVPAFVSTTLVDVGSTGAHP